MAKTTVRWSLSGSYNKNRDHHEENDNTDNNATDSSASSDNDESDPLPQLHRGGAIGRRLSSPGIISGSFRRLRRLSLLAVGGSPKKRSGSTDKHRNRSMSTVLGMAGSELSALAELRAKKAISARSVSTDDTGTPFKFRVVIMGQGSVGKTAIVHRFLDDVFSEVHKETVEDLHSRIYRINGVKLHAELLDTAGNLSFPAMRRISIANANAFLLVYSIVDRQSFATVKNILDEICQVRKADLGKLAIVIAGNMADMSEKRQISASHVTQWLIEHPENLAKASQLDVSAKTGYQVREAFRDIIRLSGLLDEFAAVNAASSDAQSATAAAKEAKRRFSFGKPLFMRAKSFGTNEDQQQQKKPSSNGSSIPTGKVPPSASRTPNNAISGRFRRQRTKSTVGTEDHCEDCAMQ